MPKLNKKENQGKKNHQERTLENQVTPPLKETTETTEDPEKPATATPRNKDNPESMSPEKNPTPSSLET